MVPGWWSFAREMLLVQKQTKNWVRCVQETSTYKPKTSSQMHPQFPFQFFPVSLSHIFFLPTMWFCLLSTKSWPSPCHHVLWFHITVLRLLRYVPGDSKLRPPRPPTITVPSLGALAGSSLGRWTGRRRGANCNKPSRARTMVETVCVSEASICLSWTQDGKGAKGSPKLRQRKSKKCQKISDSFPQKLTSWMWKNLKNNWHSPTGLWQQNLMTKIPFFSGHCLWTALSEWPSLTGMIWQECMEGLNASFVSSWWNDLTRARYLSVCTYTNNKGRTCTRDRMTPNPRIYQMLGWNLLVVLGGWPTSNFGAS